MQTTCAITPELWADPRFHAIADKKGFHAMIYARDLFITLLFSGQAVYTLSQIRKIANLNDMRTAKNYLNLLVEFNFAVVSHEGYRLASNAASNATSDAPPLKCSNLNVLDSKESNKNLKHLSSTEEKPKAKKPESIAEIINSNQAVEGSPAWWAAKAASYAAKASVAEKPLETPVETSTVETAPTVPVITQIVSQPLSKPHTALKYTEEVLEEEHYVFTRQKLWELGCNKQRHEIIQFWEASNENKEIFNHAFSIAIDALKFKKIRRIDGYFYSTLKKLAKAAA